MKVLNNNIGIIFDMDGVVVDNTKYHILAWQKFAKTLGADVSEKTVREKFLGRLGREIIKEIANKNLSQKQIQGLDAEREAYYRKIYAKAIKPVDGLLRFLKYLESKKINTALATAAPPLNVEFVLKRTKLGKYFKVIVDATGIKRGKPSPDIFLKAAKLLKVKPDRCVVFEDAFMGIEAAKRAGMKVVGVSTSHRLSELRHTDLVIKNFKKIKLVNLFKLIS